MLFRSDAVHRADIDAGIAFDTQRRGEHGFDIAVKAAAGLRQRQLGVEAEFDLRLDAAERGGIVAMRHREPGRPAPVLQYTPAGLNGTVEHISAGSES